MKKFLLFALLAVMAVFANAQETDVTSLDWTQKGQGCVTDFDNPNGGTVYGTDAGGTNLSYVDLSAYGQISLYGTPGQRARLFVNREEIGDKGIIFVDINEEGVGVYDFNNLLALQPTIQYIHLNGVKASAWDTHLNLSKITVSGDPIPFPEDVWVCPEGETDVTKLAWVQNAQGCTNNLGSMTDAAVWGTDAGGENISYVDLSSYGMLKVYGPAGQRARFFINREEFSDGTWQFFADIDETGVGVLNLASVLAAQEGAEYIHLNGIKASSYGLTLQINGITVVEAPWTCPEGEIDYTTLGIKGDNNIGKPLNGGDVVCGNQSNGDDYTDVTAYETVKFYGTPGAMLRIFANRAGAESVTVGKNEQRVTIGEDGVGTLNIAEVMTATEKEYCYLSGIKICASWQVDGVTIVDNGVVIKGITVSSEAAPEPETYTITTTAGKIGTVALDYPATIEGATLYEVVGFSTTDGLAIAEVEGDMVGGTPYIYLAEADEVVCTKTGASVAHSSFNCTMDEVGNGLVGCYFDLSYPNGWPLSECYVISNKKLRKMANGNVTIPANRCFFDPAKCTSNSMSSAKMVIAPAEDATAIKNVNAALEGGKIYDMNGREVKSMQKGGIYVVGGMKISVK